MGDTNVLKDVISGGVEPLTTNEATDGKGGLVVVEMVKDDLANLARDPASHTETYDKVNLTVYGRPNGHGSILTRFCDFWVWRPTFIERQGRARDKISRWQRALPQDNCSISRHT